MAQLAVLVAATRVSGLRRVIISCAQSFVQLSRRCSRCYTSWCLGLPDGLGTNPLNADTDNDGLTDAEESKTNTDPLKADTDVGISIIETKDVSAAKNTSVKNTNATILAPV